MVIEGVIKVGAVIGSEFTAFGTGFLVGGQNKKCRIYSQGAIAALWRLKSTVAIVVGGI
jgi:hypothetical protein